VELHLACRELFSLSSILHFFFLSNQRERKISLWRLLSTVEFAMPGSLPAPDLQIQATKVEKEKGKYLQFRLHIE
jgi:hypothetical protein